MIAQVVVDVLNKNTDKVFDYLVPKDVTLSVGSRAVVPFGSKDIEGFVLGVTQSTDVEDGKLKEIKKCLDAQPMLTENMLRLCFFMKEKFYLRLIDCIRLFLPPFVLNGKVKPKVITYLSQNFDTMPTLSGKSKKQLDALLYIQEVGEEKKSVLVDKFGSSPIKTLVDKGYLKVIEREEKRAPASQFSVAKKQITLNPAQQQTADVINKSKYQTFLLHGVTGSGKTEVYINCIKNALAHNKTAIMLVPEISLTPQMFARFKNAFGDTVAILHSSLSQGERFDEWNRLKSGQAKIAIGARSCIFAPLENVGLVVIDEEHDSSYYSESNPRFHTHEVARYLAYINNCPLILGSATPSVESMFRAKSGEYRLLQLVNRANNKELPPVEIVDMLSEIRLGNTDIFSNKLLQKIDDTIRAKKQTMIFLNRRGFSSFLMCRECGYVPKCQDCDVSLVYHKEDNMLKCHYCSKRYNVPTLCPECKKGTLRYGAVGTQRVVEELKQRFKDVPIFRLDNDSTQEKGSYVKILEEFNKTTPAILVGTQMIAKGHDFNNVALVGIVDADVSLHFADYRAVERTFQLITQVSGRAGRSESDGSVVLQTYYPKHFAYRCASNYDYSAFFKREISLREIANFPPFAKMLRILVKSENETKAEDTLQQLFKKIKGIEYDYPSDFIYLNAMRCPKKRLQKSFRFQILMRIREKSADDICKKIYAECDKIPQNNVSIFVELDPQNLS